MRRFHPCGRFVSIKKNAVRDGTLVLATKHTLCAQRKKHTLHTGGTTRDARRSTAQNCYFVQLAFVQAGWCLLHAACKGLLCAGHKACVFLGAEPCITHLSIFVWARFEAIIKYRAWHPLRGRPRSFRLFLSVLLLTGFHSRPTGFCEPPGLLVTFFSASTARTVLRHTPLRLLATACEVSALVPTANSLPSALLIVKLTIRSRRSRERLVKSGSAAFLT